MNLKYQVCSLELAKRIKELGVKQGDSYFVYDSRGILLERVGDLGKALEFWTDAFTVAELGELLPPMYFTQKVYDGDYLCYHQYNVILENSDIVLHAKTEADARAKMLIYLIEEGIVKP